MEIDTNIDIGIDIDVFRKRRGEVRCKGCFNLSRNNNGCI